MIVSNEWPEHVIEAIGLMAEDPELSRKFSEKPDPDWTPEELRRHHLSIIGGFTEQGYENPTCVGVFSYWLAERNLGLYVQSYVEELIAEIRWGADRPQSQIASDHYLGVNGAASKTERRTALNAKLGLKPPKQIDAIIKIGTDRARFSLDSRGHRWELGRTADLFSLRRMQSRISEITDIVPTMPDKKDVTAFAQAIIDIAEFREVGPEATELGHIVEIIRRHINENPYDSAITSWEERARMRLPFVLNGRTYISLDGLRQTAKNWDEKLSDSILATRLRAMDREPQAFNVAVGTERTTRRCWVVNMDALNRESGE